MIIDNFKPNLTPREVIESGAFGGSYFGEENLSGDTQYCHLFKDHFDGLDRSLYEGEKYSPKKNKYKVRSGMDYKYWSDNNWMHEDDPYGWFEWYCKYSSGRRHSDDDRQIKRWQDFCGINGRWRKVIYRKIYESKSWDVSPRIQQSLLHWGYRVNEEDFIKWQKSTNHKLITINKKVMCINGAIFEYEDELGYLTKKSKELKGWGFDMDGLRESEGALSSLDRRSPRAISTNLTEEEWCSYAGMPSPSAYID